MSGAKRGRGVRKLRVIIIYMHRENVIFLDGPQHSERQPSIKTPHICHINTLVKLGHIVIVNANICSLVQAMANTCYSEGKNQWKPCSNGM